MLLPNIVQFSAIRRIAGAAALVLIGAACGQTSIPVSESETAGTTEAGTGGPDNTSSESGGVATDGVNAAGGATVTREGPGRGSGDARAKGLSILAWNIENFPLTPEAPDLVAKILGELQPDLVGVEEIDDEAAFYALADALPETGALVADDPYDYTRVGLLYRKDRVTVDEVETLFPDDGYAFPRPPLKVHVTMLDGGFDFDFVAIHAKAMSDSKSEARRRAGNVALDKWMSDRLAEGADPDIVLAGDFNDKLTDAPHDNVFQVFLNAPEQYQFLTQPLADEEESSYIPFPSLIDHVLVTSSVLEAYGAGSTEVVHLEDTVPDYRDAVSDHRPILTRFASP